MPEQPIYDKKNIIVTGGAGFIGSHLCEKLLAGGARVICVDNLISSTLNNIDFLLKNPDFEFIRHDINSPFDPEQFPELERFKIKFQGIQEIYHLACPMSPKNFEQTRMQTLYANSIGMKHALDLAVKYHAKFLLTSTSTIYGPRPADNHVLLEDEKGEVDMHGARACYDEGKRFAETCCRTYMQVHGVDAKVARIFRTYGPRERLYSGEMIPDFIINALDNKDIEIYGDETFTTSLCYVTDVVDGLMKLMETKGDVGPVNIGSDLDMPLVEVVRSILEMTGSTSKIVFKPALMFMTPLGLPSLVKAKERLGWMPLVPLEEGLKKIIDYTMAYKNILSDFGKPTGATLTQPSDLAATDSGMVM